MSNLLDRYEHVRKRIHSAAMKNQDNASPLLLAVSKKHSLDKIRQLVAAGQCDFGESYVQEAVKKIKQSNDLKITWHFIGPIQSNKTRQIAENFQWVHSVDRLKVLKLLNQHRAESHSRLNVLLQLKVGDEASKSGVSAEELMKLATTASQYKHISLRGLMCIPPPSDNFVEQSEFFKTAKSVFDKLSSQYESVDTLSIGMSGDLEAALDNGSTLVRIGTDIFGARQY